MDVKIDRAPQGLTQIGEWSFNPASAELAGVTGERRPLEHRAAKTLALLCARRGEIVSREELIDAVWDGRTLSDNTVAVVISGLRKALGDDSNNPRHIETVAKRGYRLLSDVPVNTPRAGSTIDRRRTTLALGAAALAVVAGAAFLVFGAAAPRDTIVTIRPFDNKTGEERYNAVAASADSFAAEALAKAPRSILIRDFADKPAWEISKWAFRRFGRRARVYHLSGAIVVDGGRPLASLAAADGRDWSVVWTASFPIDGAVREPVGAAIDTFLTDLDRETPDAGN